MKTLRTKALRKINALKSIAYKTYGPRIKDLINIINNSICSLFYYSCSITNKFSHTQFQACNIIQTIALIIALGLPKWTPNVVLMKIAGQEALSDKIKRLATQFFIKQIANGVHSPLFLQNCNMKIQLTKKDSAVLFTHCIEMRISTDHIITLPDHPFSQLDLCEIQIADFSFQNKSQPTYMIKNLFKETIDNNFQKFFIIATDASKSQNLTTIADLLTADSFAYRINPLNSIFTAEALALCQAIDDLSNSEKNLLFLSDSLSVLKALKNISIKSPKVIQRLAHKIFIRTSFNQKIIFLWIPGHADITWNEKAISLAITVSDSNPYIDWVAAEDRFNHLRKLSGKNK